jgi:hypothetical protein
VQPVLPDFYWYDIPKRGKYNKLHLPKLPQNISNGNEIDQMAIKMPTSSIARPSKIYPVWDFWFGNMPSGNPAYNWQIGFLLIGP